MMVYVQRENEKADSLTKRRRGAAYFLKITCNLAIAFEEIILMITLKIDEPLCVRNIKL